MSNGAIGATQLPGAPRRNESTHAARRPHIVLVVPRGEAVRNFLYSDTLRLLNERARVTLLSVVTDDKFVNRFKPLAEIIPLVQHPEHRVLSFLRLLTDTAHDRWLGSVVAHNRADIREHETRTPRARLKRRALTGMAAVMARRGSLVRLTKLEQQASWTLRSTNEFTGLFKRLQPDLVFNCSHIHGPAGDLPLKVASRMGIPTAGFIFSWDNLTSRSRIFVPYDWYLVWNEQMRRDLVRIYDFIDPAHVIVTGTPQFDFHSKPEFWLDREELCRRIGADPARPMVLYTTGIDKHFPQEHLHVQLVARLLDELPLDPKPQLIVRLYVKGTSPEMRALAAAGLPNTIFPQVLWEERWLTPMYEDVPVYTSLLRQCSLGINAASTVSLELLMHDKPVINLGFDPPGSSIPHVLRFDRHLDFDHYRPIVEGGATMVARSPDDMRAMLLRGLTQPEDGHDRRKAFIKGMFGDTLDGQAGRRVAERLLELAGAVRV